MIVKKKEKKKKKDEKRMMVIIINLIYSLMYFIGGVPEEQRINIELVTTVFDICFAILCRLIHSHNLG